MPEWGPTDYILLTCLIPLVVASGFFSGSETALFGLTGNQRLRLRQSGSMASQAVENLLGNPRMLLITILLGNMVVNVLYFVISSVLMLHSGVGLFMEVLLALGTLLWLVLLGEVLPKILANNKRLGFARFVAPLLLTLHQLLGPIRIVIDTLIVTPLSRLTAPTSRPPKLDEQELKDLLELSSQQGAIDPDEQRMLADVIRMCNLKVRDVMTPRVKVRAIPLGAARSKVIEIARETRLTKLPVYENDLDHVVGILHIKSFLIDDHDTVRADLACVTEPRFVPEVASLEQLLDHFRTSTSQSAIVVDEYGGTEGIVAIEDVVEEIVGDIVGQDEQPQAFAMLIGFDTWQINPDVSLHEWADAFSTELPETQASTLGGLIMEKLGRTARKGDVISFFEYELSVEELRGVHISSIIQRRVTTQPPDDPSLHAEDQSP